MTATPASGPWLAWAKAAIEAAISGYDAVIPPARGPSVVAADVRPTTRAVVTAMRNGISHQATTLAETVTKRRGRSQRTSASAASAALNRVTVERPATTRTIAETT